jgi:murein DD-endopeptidase MepM/ murein hydrolase activator NlpD
MYHPKRVISVSRPGGRLGLAAILALMVMVCQAPFAYPPRAFAAGIRRMDLVHQQREIESKKIEARRQMRAAAVKARAAGYELKAVERRLRDARNDLAETQGRLRGTRDQLQDVNRRLEGARARLQAHRRAMGDRLVIIYEFGGVRYLDVLVRAAGFAYFANRLYLVQLVVDQDLGLMRGMEAERRRIESYRRAVEAKEDKIAKLEVQIARKHDEYDGQRQEKKRLVGKLEQQRRYWARALAQMERDSRDIAAQIRRYQRTTGRYRYATPWTGSFLRPVQGPITSGFGYRMHPILKVRKMHTGVDIAAATGTPIRAADTGTVIWSGSRGGYGQCVIIDHGGGMSTVYGHCSRLACRIGEEVRKGEVVGYVGSTGLATGPHLHFEVRRNGRPINPLSF